MSDVHGKHVRGISARFREAFFFQLQAPVLFVKGHAELVWSRGKRVFETEWLALLLSR